MPRACFVVNDQWQDDSEVAKCLVTHMTWGLWLKSASAVTMIMISFNIAVMDITVLVIIVCTMCSTTAIRIVITLIITISINIAIPTAILRIMRIIIGISRLLCRWPRRQQWREPSPC